MHNLNSSRVLILEVNKIIALPQGCSAMEIEQCIADLYSAQGDILSTSLKQYKEALAIVKELEVLKDKCTAMTRSFQIGGGE